MRLTTQDDRQSLARLAYAALAASLILIAAVSIAHGDEREYRFNLYAADRGAGEAAMRFKVQVKGPGPLAVCYVIGALSVEALNQKHPDKDFMGGCQNGELLTLRELSDRALGLLPTERTK